MLSVSLFVCLFVCEFCTYWDADASKNSKFMALLYASGNTWIYGHFSTLKIGLRTKIDFFHVWLNITCGEVHCTRLLFYHKNKVLGKGPRVHRLQEDTQLFQCLNCILIDVILCFVDQSCQIVMRCIIAAPGICNFDVH